MKDFRVAKILISTNQVEKISEYISLCIDGQEMGIQVEEHSYQFRSFPESCKGCFDNTVREKKMQNDRVEEVSSFEYLKGNGHRQQSENSSADTDSSEMMPENDDVWEENTYTIGNPKDAALLEVSNEDWELEWKMEVEKNGGTNDNGRAAGGMDFMERNNNSGVGSTLFPNKGSQFMGFSLTPLEGHKINGPSDYRWVMG